MKFYSDPSLIDVSSLAQNVYDLNASYFYVSLLPISEKHRFLARLNPEARRAYSSILSIKDEFVHTEDECDCIVFPPCSPYIGFDEYISKYDHVLQRTNKPVALFYFSSDDRVINVGSAIHLFRGGSYRSHNNDNVHGSLYVVADYYRGKLAPKELKVSYCGFPGNNAQRNEVITQFCEYDYFNLVSRTMWGGDILVDSSTRDSYSIGPSDKTKREFIENMEDSLYSLVVRGTSNATYRFIESFMMGRIPVFIDTDCMLPFDDVIPYKTNMVYLQYDDDYDAGIRKFHDSHTEEELHRIQLENRSIWEQYFRADNAFYNVKSLLANHML